MTALLELNHLLAGPQSDSKYSVPQTAIYYYVLLTHA